MDEIVQVKQLARKNKSVLVEWIDDAGHVRRAFVPPDQLLEDDGCPLSVLHAGIPHGLPWAQLVELTATPEAIEHELHRVGIWTFEDLQAGLAQAGAALRNVYGVDVVKLVAAARSYTAEATADNDGGNSHE